MEEQEKTKNSKEEQISPTLDNISEAVGKFPLGNLAERESIFFRLAEAEKERKHELEKAKLNEERVKYKERYRARLEELKNLLAIVRPADFVKIVPGISGGYVISVINEEGSLIYKNPVADFVIVVGIISIIYLVFAWKGHSERAKEIRAELEKET